MGRLLVVGIVVVALASGGASAFVTESAAADPSVAAEGELSAPFETDRPDYEEPPWAGVLDRVSIEPDAVSVETDAIAVDLDFDFESNRGSARVRSDGIDDGVERSATTGLCAVGLTDDAPTAIDVDGDESTVSATFTADGEAAEYDDRPEGSSAAAIVDECAAGE